MCRYQSRTLSNDALGNQGVPGEQSPAEIEHDARSYFFGHASVNQGPPEREVNHCLECRYDLRRRIKFLQRCADKGGQGGLLGGDDCTKLGHNRSNGDSSAAKAARASSSARGATESTKERAQAGISSHRERKCR